jgi:hypothetical protein
MRSAGSLREENINEIFPYEIK